VAYIVQLLSSPINEAWQESPIVTRWIVTIYLATGIISICSKFDTQYATHDTFVVKISLLITRLITSPVNILY